MVNYLFSSVWRFAISNLFYFTFLFQIFSISTPPWRKPPRTHPSKIIALKFFLQQPLQAESFVLRTRKWRPNVWSCHVLSKMSTSFFELQNTTWCERAGDAPEKWYTLRTTLRCTIIMEGKSPQSQRTVTHTNAATMRSRFKLFFLDRAPRAPSSHNRLYIDPVNHKYVLDGAAAAVDRQTIYRVFISFSFQEYWADYMGITYDVEDATAYRTGPPQCGNRSRRSRLSFLGGDEARKVHQSTAFETESVVKKHMNLERDRFSTPEKLHVNQPTSICRGPCWNCYLIRGHWKGSGLLSSWFQPTQLPYCIHLHWTPSKSGCCVEQHHRASYSHLTTFSIPGGDWNFETRTLVCITT